MKHFFSVLLALALVFVANILPVAAVSDIEVISEAAVLMDADTGQILYEKNMNRRMFPASTTKILTGIIAAEMNDMNETVTVSQEAVRLPWDSSHIALSPGENLSLSEAMYATMLASANDAANVVAEHVAGSNAAFADLMNQKAAEIGAKNSHFVNPSGLSAAEHYTTAYDLALITAYGAKNPVFMTYFGAPVYTISATNLQPEQRPLTNYQYMLLPESSLYYPSIVGGKVGFTNEAQHTMSTVASRDGRTLVCVVLKSPYRTNKFSDTKKLLDYGFDSFRPATVDGKKLGDLVADILDDGAVIGQVSFKPADHTAYIPLELNPSDIEFQVDLPGSFEADGMIACTVRYSIKDPATGRVWDLGTQELTAQVDYHDDYTLISAMVQPKQPSPVWLFVKAYWPYALAGIVSVAALMLCGMLIKVWIYKQRFLRRQRRYRTAGGTAAGQVVYRGRQNDRLRRYV